MAENEGVKESVESPTTETPNPTEPAETTEHQAREAPPRGGSENAIPHWRVKEMIDASEKRWADKYTQAEQQVQQYQEFLRKAQEGMLKSFGLYEEEKPSYVDAKSFQESLSSLESKIRNEIQQQQLRSSYESGWREVASKHQKWLGVPGFQEAIARGWAESGDMMKAADTVAKEYEKILARQSNEYIEEKEGQKARAGTVVKPGGGTGSAGKPKSTREELTELVKARGGFSE